jgi:hypothetical protein
METLNATPKATFYTNELACELADLFIHHTYQYTTEVIWEDDKEGGSKYTEFMQEQFDDILSKIENKLNNIKLN